MCILVHEKKKTWKAKHRIDEFIAECKGGRVAKGQKSIGMQTCVWRTSEESDDYMVLLVLMNKYAKLRNVQNINQHCLCELFYVSESLKEVIYEYLPRNMFSEGTE